MRTETASSVEEDLRAQLARADALAGTVQPILLHLLGSDNAAVFSDEILARVRGMASHLARQLLDLLAAPDEIGCLQVLEQALLQDADLLTHFHALAIEWQWTERLEQRFAMDPVVPPLLQLLIASPDAETKAAGMKVLAAQARWCQSQRRMQLELAELPAELVQTALLVLRSAVPAEAASADLQVRTEYNEGASRLALVARLVTSLGASGPSALELGHAGFALFATALGLASRQPRDQVVLATHEAQMTRLALALRAAGMAPQLVDQQILVLHPDARPPQSIGHVTPEQAATILASPNDPRR